MAWFDSSFRQHLHHDSKSYSNHGSNKITKNILHHQEQHRRRIPLHINSSPHKTSKATNTTLVLTSNSSNLPLLILSLMILFAASLPKAAANGRLIEPTMRSSLWRFDSEAPINYKDHGLNCGGRQIQYRLNGGLCGVCGDSFSGPRDNEDGGIFASGTVVRRYRSGTKVTMVADLVVPKGGYFEVKLCPRDILGMDVTQECFDAFPLQITNGRGQILTVGSNTKRHSGLYKMEVQLPPGITCAHCVIQWRYVTDYNHRNSVIACKTCTPPEEYRNCADVTIGYYGDQEASPGQPDDLSLGLLSQKIQTYMFSTGVAPLVINRDKTTSRFANRNDLWAAMGDNDDDDDDDDDDESILRPGRFSEFSQRLPSEFTTRRGRNSRIGPFWRSRNQNAGQGYATLVLGGERGGDQTFGSIRQQLERNRGRNLLYGSRSPQNWQRDDYDNDDDDDDDDDNVFGFIRRHINQLHIPAINRNYDRHNNINDVNDYYNVPGENAISNGYRLEPNLTRLVDDLLNTLPTSYQSHSISRETAQPRGHENHNRRQSLDQLYSNSRQNLASDYPDGLTSSSFGNEPYGETERLDNHQTFGFVDGGNDFIRSLSYKDYMRRRVARRPPAATAGEDPKHGHGKSPSQIGDSYGSSLNGQHTGSKPGSQNDFPGGQVSWPGSSGSDYGSSGGDVPLNPHVPGTDIESPGSPFSVKKIMDGIKSLLENPLDYNRPRKPGPLAALASQIQDKLTEAWQYRAWLRALSSQPGGPIGGPIGLPGSPPLFPGDLSGFTLEQQQMLQQLQLQLLQQQQQLLAVQAGSEFPFPTSNDTVLPGLPLPPPPPLLPPLGPQLFQWLPDSTHDMSLVTDNYHFLTAHAANQYLSAFAEATRGVQLPFLCPSPHQLVCIASPAYRQIIPGADAICTEACRRGQACGEQYCACACQPRLTCIHQSSLSAAGPGAQGFPSGGWPGPAMPSDLDAWCTAQCSSGNCPRDQCFCSVM